MRACAGVCVGLLSNLHSVLFPHTQTHRHTDTHTHTRRHTDTLADSCDGWCHQQQRLVQNVEEVQRRLEAFQASNPPPDTSSIEEQMQPFQVHTELWMPVDAYVYECACCLFACLLVCSRPPFPFLSPLQFTQSHSHPVSHPVTQSQTLTDTVTHTHSLFCFVSPHPLLRSV